jgi:hypothetical protein
MTMRHPKKWPIIRHVRFAIEAWRWENWWHNMGRHFGAFPNQRDLDYLDAIWRGDV